LKETSKKITDSRDFFMKNFISVNPKSFNRKVPVILSLTAIIPFLMVVYLFAHEKLHLTNAIILVAAFALFSILNGYALMRKSGEQLVDLSKRTENMASGNSLEPININADDELNDIARSFNSIAKRMDDLNREIKEQSVKLMLYSSDLYLSLQKIKKEEEFRNRLTPYVGEALVDKLLNLESGGLPENERREVTVFFADIRSFSSIAERTSAEDVVLMLNQFFETTCDIIFRNNGVLDKFMGDEIMAVFGLLPSDKGAPYDAVKTATELQEAMKDLSKARFVHDQEPFAIGIGINTGAAVVGNVGSKKRMAYTVIGDSVNIAARLVQLACENEIVIGQNTYDKVKDLFNIGEKGELTAKGKKNPIMSYSVLQDVA
jgi:class 3 adenylate cyclase/HAMP domain-containing protein